MARITQSQMAKMFHRFATSYHAGLDIRSILKRESSIGSASHRINTGTLAKEVSKGKSLAEAMQSTNGYFPDLAISVVHAGERGGRLEDSFARLAEHYRSLVEFRNRFLTALAWPLFEMLFAILIVGGLMALCDWIFYNMEMEKINWLLMGSTTGNVIAYFVLVFFMIGGVITLIMGTAKGWFGTLPMKIARRIPLIGNTIECMAMSRFAWTMSVAENAGMNPIEIAQLSLRSTENYYYKQLEPKVCKLLQKGHAFYPVFKSTESFPEDLLIYIDSDNSPAVSPLSI